MKVTKRRLIEEKLNLLEEKKSFRKLTKDELKEKEELEKKLVQSKRGSGSKRKGATFERKIAKLFKDALNIDLVRTPLSGGFAKKNSKADSFRGDITTVDKNIEFGFHIECKDQKTLKLRDWINQAESDCPEGAIPLVIFHKGQVIKDNKVVDKSGDYVTLSLTDFLSLVHREDVIKEKEDK